MRTFHVDITLSDDMADSLDIAMALKDLADDMADTLDPRTHSITDINGRTVGTARFSN